MSQVRDALSRAITFAGQSRAPLRLQHHKPIPLATYLPKFDEGFNPNRRFDPDSERAEASKLRALYRKEKKGAVRDLRNDNRFLAVEESKRKQEENQQYEKKVRLALPDTPSFRGCPLTLRCLPDLQDRQQSSGRACRGEGFRAHEGEGQATRQGTRWTSLIFSRTCYHTLLSSPP